VTGTGDSHVQVKRAATKRAVLQQFQNSDSKRTMTVTLFKHDFQISLQNTVVQWRIVFDFTD
jgi:hypothetical protein